MAKSRSIGPNVARILAEKIVAAIKENAGDKKDIVKQLNEEVNNSPEVKKGIQLVEQLKAINAQISKKYDKYLNQSYKKVHYFSVTDKKQWLAEYMLADSVKLPTVDSIKDEIVLESAFSEAGSPEEVIAKYINKYTKKK